MGEEGMTLIETLNDILTTMRVRAKSLEDARSTAQKCLDWQGEARLRYKREGLLLAIGVVEPIRNGAVRDAKETR